MPSKLVLADLFAVFDVKFNKQEQKFIIDSCGPPNKFSVLIEHLPVSDVRQAIRYALKTGRSVRVAEGLRAKLQSIPYRGHAANQIIEAARG